MLTLSLHVKFRLQSMSQFPLCLSWELCHVATTLIVVAELHCPLQSESKSRRKIHKFANSSTHSSTHNSMSSHSSLNILIGDIFNLILSLSLSPRHHPSVCVVRVARNERKWRKSGEKSEFLSSANNLCVKVTTIGWESSSSSRKVGGDRTQFTFRVRLSWKR